MLTSATIIGRLGDIVPETDGRIRYIEIDETKTTELGAGVFKTYRYPVYVMVGTSLIQTEPSGTLAFVKGRLTQIEGLGIVIIDEQDEIFKSKKGLEEIVSRP
ncbi:MAG: hypothetical protein LKF75_04645 [Bacilli bacterium]|jgi:hypothetical protein|nr:hypothetical protein [Bacilli bacterium]MCH4210318.1 hypothetical protein [Bacilli bacterium]MCH4228961.1 hypothetical protein [Bacilli bacterium]MCH4278410.1 hypothetical protein [Bacilli bacterium]MCI2054808.1 hypothetical protein [Bacilli bacterium]